MVFWWPEEGLAHSRRMLVNELGYLGNDFRGSLLTSDPARLAAGLSEGAHSLLFEATRLDQVSEWLRETDAMAEPSDAFRLRPVYRVIADGITAAGQVVQLFVARLATLVLATPAFALFSMVGAVDGLVQRDLRRWGGGRESSYLYHYAKRSVGGFLLAAWFIYLALPVSVNPAFVILPFATLFAFSISVTAGTFKKYI